MTITDGRGLIERIRTALSRKSLEALQTSPQTLIDDKAVDVNIAPASSDGDRIAILDADRPATAISDSYLAPGNLALAPWTPRRALLIGACFLFQWADYLKTAGITTEVDRILFANVFRMPPDPPSPATDYDFALAQVPLASVCPELDHARLAFDDVAGHEALFEDCVARLDLFLQEALVWSDRIPTFVMTYLLPQQDLLGRLQPRYDLRNPAYFVDRLNMELERLLRARPNAYLLDANGIAATYGRRYVQEDALWTYFHGGINEGMDRLFDTDKSVSVVDFYDVDLVGFVTEIWYGACASYRSLKGLDAIKMLCVDLDDTLWRGTIGELEGVLPIQIIGWPTGLLEALLYLKKRGVLLAILSKNDESRVRSCWDKIFEGKISIDDFGVVKINWKPKAENMAEAISDANLLPQNVAFLDDNPVERHAIRIAFPQVRIIEGPHFRWRRILGWSAEFRRLRSQRSQGDVPNSYRRGSAASANEQVYRARRSSRHSTLT